MRDRTTEARALYDEFTTWSDVRVESFLWWLCRHHPDLAATLQDGYQHWRDALDASTRERYDAGARE